jgi:TPR repeat protein
MAMPLFRVLLQGRPAILLAFAALVLFPCSPALGDRMQQDGPPARVGVDSARQQDRPSGGFVQLGREAEEEDPEAQQMDWPLLRGAHEEEGLSAEELAECRQAAEDGSTKAQIHLAFIYYHGESVERDYAESARWHRVLAEKGRVYSQFRLGVMHYLGRGVPRDYNEAMRWFRIAAESGDKESQYNLGIGYEKGQGLPQDYQQAISWFRQAADQGHPRAQLKLGLMAYHGIGLPQDFAKAFTLIEGAANLGDPKAQYNTGLLYLNGKGVRKNAHLADRWLDLSAAHGNADAARLRGPKSRTRKPVRFEISTSPR